MQLWRNPRYMYVRAKAGTTIVNNKVSGEVLRCNLIHATLSVRCVAENKEYSIGFLL